MKISIIIPVYNEEKTIAETLTRTCAASLPENFEREILVVDDGSTDRSLDVIQAFQKDPRIRILKLNENRGKTEALMTGIAAAQGEYLIFQDADLEYDPVHYERLLRPVASGKTSVVFGSRFKGTIKCMNPVISAANSFNTWFVNLLFRSDLTDVNTGFKVLPRNLFEKIRVTSKRFGGDAEITAWLLRKRYPIVEVPIHYTARSKKEGKKMNWVEAIHMFSCFVYHRFVYGDR